MLSYELNSKIKRFAPSLLAKDIAPSTFEDLMRLDSKEAIVWSGASECTIYGDPSVNYAMRAWHDSLHRKLSADFSLAGETRVALEHCRLIESDGLARIIWAEVVGQAEFFERFGQFPENQVEFILGEIK